MLATVNAAKARTCPGGGNHAGPAMRRFGRLFRHHRQSGWAAVDILVRHGGTGILSETPGSTAPNIC